MILFFFVLFILFIFIELFFLWEYLFLVGELKVALILIFVLMLLKVIGLLRILSSKVTFFLCVIIGDLFFESLFNLLNKLLLTKLLLFVIERIGVFEIFSEFLVFNVWFWDKCNFFELFVPQTHSSKCSHLG